MSVVVTLTLDVALVVVAAAPTVSLCLAYSGVVATVAGCLPWEWEFCQKCRTYIWLHFDIFIHKCMYICISFSLFIFSVLFHLLCLLSSSIIYPSFPLLTLLSILFYNVRLKVCSLFLLHWLPTAIFSCTRYTLCIYAILQGTDSSILQVLYRVFHFSYCPPLPFCLVFLFCLWHTLLVRTLLHIALIVVAVVVFIVAALLPQRACEFFMKI